jgi:hypothetical protein
MPFGCFRQNDNEYQYYYSCNYHITSIWYDGNEYVHEYERVCLSMFGAGIEMMVAYWYVPKIM